ncbi:helix-turn-helix domain-containing protein [Clostridium beijerinckii]|uniref:helix-turn-helix domain-containing protein n=1 Tax=Clostridium beijerinckii TaxID=1520 RepID=UPI0014940FBE|nr:helix-turn-helix transcriptional regulator [Clostridium beijerinckii]NOW08081.1 transcriptional regulator with XRE-family HTH domain [Clostridium beijerinckii]NYC05643.1 transcriptional regulator with XRE-family HTH domain [Clostridium beijerinckii]
MESKWIDAGNRLREIRNETNLSVFKVAKKVHISGNYLSMLERGINCPSDAVLFNLAEFYNVDPSELFKLYDKIIPPTNEQLKNMPSLKGLITQLSIDPKLTPEEKDKFATQLYEIANNLFNKE